MRPASPGAMKQRPPSPQPASTKSPPIQKPLAPAGPPTLRKRNSKSKDLCPVQAVAQQSSDSSKTKDKDGEQLTEKDCFMYCDLTAIVTWQSVAVFAKTVHYPANQDVCSLYSDIHFISASKAGQDDIFVNQAKS